MRRSDVEPTSQALRAAFGDALRIEAVSYRSGAITVYVQRGDSCACIRTDPDNAEWSYSVGLDAAGNVPNPDHVVSSLEQTIKGIAALWPDPQ